MTQIIHDVYSCIFFGNESLGFRGTGNTRNSKKIRIP